MAASATMAVTGSAGLTGMTRAIITATLEAATTSVDVTVPVNFIPGMVLGTIAKPADGTPITAALWWDASNTKYVLKLSAAPGAGTYKIIVLGEVGRRDVPSENPQGTRP